MSSLQEKVESLSTNNALIKEDLNISKDTVEKVQVTNSLTILRKEQLFIFRFRIDENPNPLGYFSSL